MNLKYGISIRVFWIEDAWVLAHPLPALPEGRGPLDQDRSTLTSPPSRTVANLTSGDEIPSDDLDGEPNAADARRPGPERDGLVATGAHVNGGAQRVVRLKRVADPPLKHRVVRAVLAPRPWVAKQGSGLTRGPKDHQRVSLTTGRPTVNGRGLTSGWGMVNGTGMTREPAHHVSRGRFNGSGATQSATLASRDGMTNGNGLTEGGGMAAGGGMTNGSGLTQGQGMTNGNGLVRPPSGELPPWEPPVRKGGVLRRIMGT